METKTVWTDKGYRIYGYAWNGKKIGQILSVRKDGKTVDSWTGVTYRTARAASDDVARLNGCTESATKAFWNHQAQRAGISMNALIEAISFRTLWAIGFGILTLAILAAVTL